MGFKYGNVLFCWFLFLTVIFGLYSFVCLVNNRACPTAVRWLIINGVLAVFTGFYAFTRK